MTCDCGKKYSPGMFSSSRNLKDIMLEARRNKERSDATNIARSIGVNKNKFATQYYKFLFDGKFEDNANS